jgi:hypothetical protein
MGIDGQLMAAAPLNKRPFAFVVAAGEHPCQPVRASLGMLKVEIGGMNLCWFPVAKCINQRTRSILFPGPQLASEVCPSSTTQTVYSVPTIVGNHVSVARVVRLARLYMMAAPRRCNFGPRHVGKTMASSRATSDDYDCECAVSSITTSYSCLYMQPFSCSYQQLPLVLWHWH